MRIVVTTTLNNNLFHAKLAPLVNSRSDLQVVVVSDREGPAYRDLIWIYPSRLWLVLGRLGGRLPLLAREILSPKTDLVMAYSLVPHGLFALFFGKLRRVPVYLHFIGGPGEIEFSHNTDMSDNRVIAKSISPVAIERLVRFAARFADRLFVPGSRTKRFLISKGFDESRIQCLHSTVDSSIFYPGKDARNIDVLVCAQLRERKRPIFTLRILREILVRRPSARFCWLGDGPMREEFSRALDELGLKSFVEWHHTEQVADFYRRGRVFLLASISEGLSLASMEAMACGMVPVVSDCGDMGDVVINGETGSLLPIEASEVDYASAALSFLASEENWEVHSCAARELVRAKHGFSAAEAQWRLVLHRVGS